MGIAFSYSHLYLFHVVLLVSLISIPSIATKAEIWRVVKKLKYLILLYLWYLLSLAWTLDITKGIKYFIIICMGGSLIFLYPLLVKSKRDFILVLKTGGVVGVLQIVIGLLEHFTTFRWPISKYSTYNHWFGISHIEDIKILESDYTMSFPTGLSWGPNDYGVMMCIFLTFVLFSHINRWLKLSIVLLLVLNIHFTISSSALLGALLICVIFVFMKIKNKLLIFFLIFICVSGFILNSELRNRFSETSLFLSKILQTDFYSQLEPLQSKRAIYLRAYWYQEAFKAAIKHPINGMGIASSSAASIFPKTNGNMNLHFFFLEILVDVGLIGFSIFILMYIFNLKQLCKVFYLNKDKLLNTIAISIAVFLAIFPLSSIALSSGSYFLPWFLLVGMGTSLIVYAEKIRDVAENV